MTDTAPPLAQPQIVKFALAGKTVHLEWDGEGAVFQVETAPSVPGRWVQFSPILPDKVFESEINEASAAAFFRVRQW